MPEVSKKVAAKGGFKDIIKMGEREPARLPIQNKLRKPTMTLITASMDSRLHCALRGFRKRSDAP
jgi:hypothetical protein